MRVIHISTTDYGGAYRAAANISHSMQLAGVESNLLVRDRLGGEEVSESLDRPWKRIFSKVKNAGNLLLSQGDIVVDLFGTDLLNHPLLKQADVIVLHWVNSFVSYGVLEKLLKSGRPVIWVMHDMWPFTGGCHYDRECGGYRQACAACQAAPGKKGQWAARFGFSQKSRIFSEYAFTFVGPSRWITECARESALTKRQECICIPNPVDTSLYKPLAKQPLREHYQLPQQKKLILFGAMIASDMRKGFDLLLEAVSRLGREEYAVCIFGSAEKLSYDTLGLEVFSLGRIETQEEMADVYNLADVFVIPSRQENLSNSVTEALACGIPVAAFAVGGMGDMIEHKRNGYLAKPFVTEDLADGIEYCCRHTAAMKKDCTASVSERFSPRRVGQQYSDLCRRLTGQS